MKRLLPALLLSTFLAGAAHAQTIPGLDGRWEGPLSLPNGMTLTAVFRIETKDGKTTAVFDSPEQGAKGIAATIARDGDKLTLGVPVASLTYAATISADGKTLTGEISQGGGSPMAVTMTQKAATALTGPAVQGLDGRWEGEIDTPGGSITGVFRISTSGDKTTTLMDSPTQNALDIPAVAKRTGQDVIIEVPGVAGDFTGQLSADGATLNGYWSQAGQQFSLTMKRN